MQYEKKNIYFNVTMRTLLTMTTTTQEIYDYCDDDDDDLISIKIQ